MVYFELLAHFTCKKCNAWWSIASEATPSAWKSLPETGNVGIEEFLKGKEWYCPWCGHVQKHDNIENPSIDNEDTDKPNSDSINT